MSGLSSQRIKLRRTNTSGYEGVSWHKTAKKWEVHIRANGIRHNLGLFERAEDGHTAYLRAASKLRTRAVPLDAQAVKKDLLDAVHQLYKANGIKALSTPFLEKQKLRLYPRLLSVGLKQTVLLAELGLTEEYAGWRASARTYRGVTKPTWSWGAAVAKAKEIKEREGDLPTVQWFRMNGYSSLTNAVHGSGRTWEDLRKALGSPASASFHSSRNEMRWRSRPEASLSNFLYARGVDHKRGERYPQAYTVQSGRHHGHFDMHFVSAKGVWIDVEVWGDLPDKMSGGRYRVTRKKKETWNASNKDFIGIQYQDCLSDARLSKILEPYIGIIAPFRFDKPTDRMIETAHWSDYDEFLATCKELAAQMPGGIFPGESWLRKRGKDANRPGETYNTLAGRVHQWLGGTRAVRKLLGHAHASTIQWTPERAIAAWRDFEKTYGFTPSQGNAGVRRKSVPQHVGAEAGKIYSAVRLLGLLSEARNGRTARKIKWTPDTVLAAWTAFYKKYGKTPTQCMSSAQRKKLPRTVTDEATNIYSAALRLGLLSEIRAAKRTS
jgi:hypothetical protein